MGNPPGVPRDLTPWKNAASSSCVCTSEGGETPATIARRLKTGDITVHPWPTPMVLRARGGAEAGRAGRKPRPSKPQRRRLEKLLLEGPERLENAAVDLSARGTANRAGIRRALP